MLLLLQQCFKKVLNVLVDALGEEGDDLHEVLFEDHTLSNLEDRQLDPISHDIDEEGAVLEDLL